MKIFSMLLFLLSVLSLLSQPSDSTTILVDGFSEWKDPNVYIGDSISEHLKTHHFSISLLFFFFRFLCCKLISLRCVFIFLASLSFQSQVSLQVVHFPEPKSLQPLQLHSSYASHQAQFHLLHGISSPSLSIVITIMYKIPCFYTCILGCYKKCLKILCS